MKRRDAWAIGAVWLLIVSIYVPILAGGRVLVDNPALLDISFNEMPNVHWMADSWGRGEFPLWNPHTDCGMPDLGYSHAGGLYLLRVLLFRLFPYIWAFSFSIVLHSMAAAALFYLILRRRGVERFFSGSAALIMVLSGGFLAEIYVLWMLGSMCGFLLAWLCLEELLKRPRLGWFLGAVLGVAWCGIAGDAELLAYGLMLLGFLQVLEGGLSPRKAGRTALWFVVIAGAGFLLMSPMVLSTMETVHFSIRGPQMPYELKIISTGYSWSALIPTMLLPFKYYLGLNPASAFNSGLPPLYQGVLVVGLAIWGLGEARREPRLRPAAIAWAGLLLFVMARESDASGRILDLIPVLRSLRFGDKAILFVHALGLMLASLMLSGQAARGKNGASSKGLGLVLAGCGGLMVLGQQWSMGGPERYVIGAAALAGGAAALVKRGGRPLLPARRAAYLAAGLAVIEVMALAWRYVPRTDPRRFDLDPQVADFARTLRPDSRYAVFEPLLSDAPDAPPPIFGTVEMASGAGNIVGPSRVQPARIFLFLTQIYRRMIYTTPSGEKMFAGWSMTNPGTLDRGRMHLFNLAGPSVIFSRGLSVPYSSPYSLVRPDAAEWELAGAGLGRGVGGEGLLKGPSLMTAGFAGYGGDRVTLAGAARGEGAGWIMLTSRDTVGQGHIILARRIPGGGAFRLEAGMESLAKGGTFGLSWVPAGERASDLALTALDIVNPARPFQEAARSGEVRIYRNSAALPRAFIVHSPVVIGGTEAVLKHMDDPAMFSPRHDVVLEKESPQARIVEQSREGRTAGPEDVEIREYGPERVEMTASLARPGFVVFTDTYFPGWRVEDESAGVRQEARIFPADLAFRAVFLPEGAHRLTWVYRPVPFRIGLWCGVFSLLAALLCPVLVRLRRGLSGRA